MSRMDWGKEKNWFFPQAPWASVASPAVFTTGSLRNICVGTVVYIAIKSYVVGFITVTCT